MPSVGFQLSINAAAVNEAGLKVATRSVVNATRQILNRAIVLTPVDTGHLRRSHQMRVLSSPQKVVGEVFNDVAYARAVHNGSEPYLIRPRGKKALKFTVGEETVFAKVVRHPGSEGRPWLATAMREIAPRHGLTVTIL